MLDLMASNFHIKISGEKLTLKRYSKTLQFNFTSKKTTKTSRGESDQSRDNFNKAIARARNRIFDVISCNVNVIPDYEGNIQLPKFITLTFAENITSLKEANAEFTHFNKRLSYYLYKENKNVLKYVCISEFQKRGAVHFHVLYFNLPYIDFKKLGSIWGQGYVFIEGIKDNEKIEDFAKYVCKYINKHNSKGEDNYQIYKEKDMLNQKRYFTSRGLNKPEEYKLEVDKELYETLLSYLQNDHIENHEIENEFVGKIEINTYEVKEKTTIETLRSVIKLIFNEMKGLYNKKIHIRYKDINTYISESANIEYLDLLSKIKNRNYYSLGIAK